MVATFALRLDTHTPPFLPDLWLGISVRYRLSSPTPPLPLRSYTSSLIYDLMASFTSSSTFAGRLFTLCLCIKMRLHCTTPTMPRKKLTAARL